MFFLRESVPKEPSNVFFLFLKGMLHVWLKFLVKRMNCIMLHMNWFKQSHTRAYLGKKQKENSWVLKIKFPGMLLAAITC